MQGQDARTLFHLGEDLAAKYLAGKGYEVIERNFRIRGGEIDIIASIDDSVVFAEVKTRRSHARRLALMNVAYTKQKRISLTAQTYVERHPEYQGCRFRFDIILVLHYRNTDTFKIEHLVDAFQPVFDDI